MTEKYDAITQLFEHAVEITTRFKIYTEVPVSQELGDIMTNNFVKLLEIFDVATKAVNEGRAW